MLTNRRELESSIRYFDGVIRTGKIEMLAGCSTAILEGVLNLLSTLQKKGQLSLDDAQFSLSYRLVYDQCVALLRWTDERLSLLADPQSSSTVVLEQVGGRWMNHRYIQ